MGLEKPPDFSPVLYRAPELARADADEWVWLTEGEKDADTAAKLGRLATTNAQGAASFPPQLVSQLAGRRVAVVIDRDAAGYNRALGLHEHLTGVASDIRFLLPATLEAKSDLTDHVEAGLWEPSAPFGGLVEVTHDGLALRAERAQHTPEHHVPRPGSVPDLEDDRDRAAPLSLDRARDLIADGTLPAGSLVIVEHAADAQPETLIDVINRANTSQARVVLLDTSTQNWPPKPSARLLSLLHTDLPWSATLNAPAVIQAHRSTPPDLAPLLAQAARLPSSLLDEQLGQALAERERVRAVSQYAYQRHLNLSWLVEHHHDRGHSLEHDGGIDL
jgi:hypothetical protein